MDTEKIRGRLVESGLTGWQATEVVLGLLELRNQIMGWLIWICVVSAVFLLLVVRAIK